MKSKDGILKYAYKKGNCIMLRDAEGYENINLFEYISQHSSCNMYLTPEEVARGYCTDCSGCVYGLLYLVALQAIEQQEFIERKLRERRKR